MHVHTDDLGGWGLERSQSGPDDYAAFKVQAEQTTCWLDAVEHRGFAAGAALALAEAAEAGGDQTMASFWANEAALMGHDALAALSDHCSFHEAEELEQCPGCSSARIAQALFVAGVAFEANGEDDAAITASEHAVRALAAAGPCADRSRVVEAPRVAAAVMRARGRFDRDLALAVRGLAVAHQCEVALAFVELAEVRLRQGGWTNADIRERVAAVRGATRHSMLLTSTARADIEQRCREIEATLRSRKR